MTTTSKMNDIDDKVAEACVSALCRVLKQFGRSVEHNIDISEVINGAYGYMRARSEADDSAIETAASVAASDALETLLKQFVSDLAGEDPLSPLDQCEWER
jgi:hypothetical protein